jgi:antitoxin (DNA-binding transcriptional repressor) of toxin-antitoxin stability system
MPTVNITEAKAHLSTLLKNLEIYNEEIIIKRGEHPIAKVSRLKSTPTKNRRVGAFEGQMKIPDDFNEWPDDVAQALGMK